MAKKRYRKAAVGHAAIRAWHRHTRQLLDHLLNEQKQIMAQLAMVDQQIDTVKNALGQQPPARRQPKRTRRRQESSDISGAVLTALARKHSLTVAEIIKATRLERTQVYACLMNLKKSRQVISKSRGSYSLASRRGAASAKEKRRAGPRTAKRAGKPRRRGGVSEAILAALQKGKTLRVAQIIKATGLKQQQVHSCLMSLKKAKKVRSKSRGIYSPA